MVQDEGMTCGNPCPVVDRDTGTIWLPFCKNPAGQKFPRTVWVTQSRDDGASWSEPLEITSAVKRPGWTWYATGPGHGIQLTTGRLLIPCDHVEFDPDRYGWNIGEDQYRSHVAYSDDHGESWHIGGEVDLETDESIAVETVDGSVYLNCRPAHAKYSIFRGYGWSRDGGQTFPETGWDQTLPDPYNGCQGSLVRYTFESVHGRNRILFSHPAGPGRANLMVRMSLDEGRNWPIGKVVHAGQRTAYSDVATLRDMTIGCLYELAEGGGHETPETIVLARFNIEWLTDGLEHVDSPPLPRKKSK